VRERLQQIEGARARFRGTFERFGERTSGGYVKRMALLKNVTDARGEEMCDHIWLNLTLRVAALDLKPGDQIEFAARVRPYVKGYYDNRRRDYRLSHPNNFTKLGACDSQGEGMLFRDAFDAERS
jgi:hypothetical protein